MPSRQPFPVARALVFLGLTASMLAGPVHSQLLGGKHSRYFKSWRMFSNHGTGLCEVEFVQVGTDGAARPLDRYALLDHHPWHTAPAIVRNLPDGPSIGRVGQALCDALGLPGPDVRARARCATKRGWKPAMQADQNLCRLEPQQVDDLLPRPRWR